MKENSVGLGQASVIGAVGPEGIVELPVGNGGGVIVAFDEVITPVVSMIGREKNPVRFSSNVVPLKPDVVEFEDTGGIVTDAGGTVVEFKGTLGVSITIVILPVDDGGRIVERLPVEKDGTVE